MTSTSTTTTRTTMVTVNISFSILNILDYVCRSIYIWSRGKQRSVCASTCVRTRHIYIIIKLKEGLYTHTHSQHTRHTLLTTKTESNFKPNKWHTWATHWLICCCVAFQSWKTHFTSTHCERNEIKQNINECDVAAVPVVINERTLYTDIGQPVTILSETEKWKEKKHEMVLSCEFINHASVVSIFIFSSCFMVSQTHYARFVAMRERWREREKRNEWKINQRGKRMQRRVETIVHWRTIIIISISFLWGVFCSQFNLIVV